MSWLALPLISVVLGLSSNVAGSRVYDLSKFQWTLRSGQGNVSVPASIPSVVHMDLFNAGVIEEPVFGDNDQRQLWVAQSDWTYSTTLAFPNQHVPQQTYLVFDGLDTFAHIALCNKSVGDADNQFRQWAFDVTDIARTADSCQLSVTFTSVYTMAEKISAQYSGEFFYSLASSISNRSLIRKEQNDFGWDWSPAFVPQGVWKPAYVVRVDEKSSSSIYVSNSAIDIFRQGQLNNLPPDQSQPWVLNISIDYIGSMPAVKSLDFEFIDGRGQQLQSGAISGVVVTRNTIQGSVVLTAGKQPDLWWPVGYGNQTLYTLNVKATGPKGDSIASLSKRVGFRTIVLNQTPISETQLALGISNGSNWHFEINGRELFVKGSNLVPLGVFWPNVTEVSARQMFEAAVAGNQNMLRVWSSGAYLPDFVYDIADELGLMLWSEFEFSDADYPADEAFVKNVKEEAYYQTRRVNHHPSLALWAGNNEISLFLIADGYDIPNLYTFSNHTDYPARKNRFEKLFLDVLVHAVFDNSRSISYSYSSTTAGYYSLNHSAATPIVWRPNATDGVYSNTDFYTYSATAAFNISKYPVGRLANEFGYPSHANFETYERYLPASELHSNSSVIVHRNRHYVNMSAADTAPDSNTNQSLDGLGHMYKAISYWLPTPNATQESPTTKFKLSIYKSQIFQAEFYRAQIEFYRYGSGQPQHTLGALYWQLNDVWAAPTWASVNADGRWKILHYVARAAYENVIVAPYVFDKTPQQASVYVSSDLWSAITATVSIEWFSWAGKSLLAMEPIHIAVGAVNSTLAANINLTNLPFNTAEAVARLTVDATSEDGRQFSGSRFFNPMPTSNQTTQHAIASNSTSPPVTISYNSNKRVFILRTTVLAGYVWINQPEGVKGHFDENGFWLLPGRKEVRFVKDKNQHIDDSAFSAWAAKVTVQSLWDSVAT